MDEFVYLLAQTRGWAGKPSFRELAQRIDRRRQPGKAQDVPGMSHSTVASSFQPGRRHLDFDLVMDLLRVMPVPEDSLTTWHEAYRRVFGSRHPDTIAQVDSELPPDPLHFTGRAAELALLAELADGDDGSGVVVVISGMAGVGKTDLAIRFGRRLLGEGRFSDAQLYIDLRGYDPAGRQPFQADAVLEELLRTIGHPGPIPVRREARRTAYRRRLTGKKVLIVLDNAADEDQVRELLPELSGTMVIVIGRSSLTGLKGVHRVQLDVLTEEEAVGLLRRTAGAHHAQARTADLAGVAAVCARLPLALRLTAAYLSSHPEITLADHVEHRAELGIHDEVQTSLEMSYRGLSEQMRRPFRLLALHPGGHLTPHAAAALADIDLLTAHLLLTTLAEKSLLRLSGPARYHFHDLVHSFAAGLTRRHDVPRQRRAALDLLLHHYQSAATTAMDLIAEHESHRRPSTEAARTPPIELADRAAARDWLDAERANLCATIEHAAVNSRPDYVNSMAQTLFRYFIIGGYHAEALGVHARAVEAARMLSDQAGEGTALRNLGVAQWLRGQYPPAAESIKQAIAVFDNLEDMGNAGRAHNNLGLVYQAMGDSELALHHHELALALARLAKDKAAEGDVLGNLAVVYWRLGRYDDALRNFERDRAIAERLGDMDGIAIALGNSGEVHQRCGRYRQAVENHKNALSIYDATGNRPGQASAHTNLGTAQERLGQHEQALASHQRALAIYTDLNEPQHLPETQAAVVLMLQRLGRIDEASELLTRYIQPYDPAEDSLSPAALNRFAEALRGADRWTEAADWHRTALNSAQGSGDRYEQARAHDGIAHSLQRRGEHEAAQQQWRAALDLYTALGVPEAEQIPIHTDIDEP